MFVYIMPVYLQIKQTSLMFVYITPVYLQIKQTSLMFVYIMPIYLQIKQTSLMFVYIMPVYLQIKQTSLMFVYTMLRNTPKQTIQDRTKYIAFLVNEKESCSQDSPPAAGRFSDVLLFRRSALLRGAFFYAMEHYGVISYSIKNGCRIIR